MSFSATITLAAAGTDTGPFNIYSDTDGFTTPFASSISKSSLLAGYVSSAVPDLTITVRVKSNNLLCTNYVDMGVNDPTVAVYQQCLNGLYYWIEAGTTSSAFAQDGGGLCYQKMDEGLYSVMLATYPGFTYLSSLVFSNCQCV